MAIFDRAKGIFALPPADDVSDEEELELTITEHLVELRTRMVRAAIGLAVGTIIGLAVTPLVLGALLAIGPPGFKPVFTTPVSNIVTYFKVGLFVGAAIAMPILLNEFIRFVAPGLTRREKKLALLALPPMAFLFASGVAFGYFVTIPVAIRYLLGFGIEFATPMITIDSYITFVTTLMFALGLGFQTPALIFVLTKIGVVTTKMLASYRKYAILVIFIVSAVITPTPDPLNQALVAVPLIILYELGILLSRIGGNK